jgi:hypothetical protein
VRERQRVKAPWWTFHGDEVAAGGRSGKPWRARGRPLGERNRTGREEDDAWKMAQQEVARR